MQQKELENSADDIPKLSTPYEHLESRANKMLHVIRKGIAEELITYII